MNLPEKLGYILLAVLLILLTVAAVYAVFAAKEYYSAVEKLEELKRKQDVGDEYECVPESEIPLTQFEHILSESKHEVSDKYALDYFDDAVFVGDSRTEGLFLYSGIAEKTEATSYAWRGFTTTDVLENKKFNIDGKYLTGADALRQNKEFTKVYIMLGVNELAPGSSDEFIERYDKIVSAALEANPKARIIIQSIIPLSDWKSELSDYVNNENTAEFNSALFDYAQENGYIWLDVGSLLSDANGALNPACDCGDGIHLTQEACKIWFEYLCYYTYF